jgi:PAS domain S-box-containing protein
MALADLEHSVPIGFEIWITLGNLAETVVAALGISRLLKGAPYLNSLQTLAKYIVFAVILVPFGSSLLGGLGSPLAYGLQERIWFLADALAFLTVTPAILSWVRDGREWARKSHNYLEFAALMASLVLFGYLTFMGTVRGVRPALLYSLVPLLLWAALRLGLKGVSTSMVVVAFLAIWGAARGRGPFSEQGALNNALSLQLFLFFAAIPFTVLAVLVEEQKRVQQALINEHALLTEAQRLAQIGSWEWDPDTDTVNWSRELYRITGRDPNLPAASYKEHSQILTAESWERLQRNVGEALRSGTPYELDLEYVPPDGSTIWARARSEAKRDTAGRIVGLRGTAQDITERKLAETELSLAHDRLRLAMEAGKSVGWDRDVKSGRDSLFGDLQSIFGIPSQVCDGRVGDFDGYLHPEDRRRVAEAIDYAMETHKPYAEEFRLRWPDGTVRWLAAKGKFYYSRDGEPERMLGIAVDITDRKLAEEALRESEERFRLAIQAGRMYAFDWDVVTAMIIRSEESTHILGLTVEPTKLTKRELLDRVHPEDRETFINSIAECTPERPDTQISYRLLRPDGSLLWLERTGHAFFDEQGTMVRMIGIVADVTERRRADEVLRRSQGYLAEAERLAHSGSWAWDTRTRDAFWSPEMFRILGYDPEKTRPSLSNFWARVHPEDRLRMERVLKEATTGLDQDVTSDYRIVLPDGTIKHIHAIAHPVTNDSGEVVEVVGTSIDVTERRRAEKALRESEERFRLVANTAPVMICMSDIDKLCSYFNQGWLDFTGRYLEEEMGDGWAERIHPEDLEECLKTYTTAFDSRERFQMEYRLRRHDGEYRWIFYSGVPRFNADGSFAGYIGSGIDVTERKLAEEALSTLSQKLIEAQEGERTRIARELHDDVGQRLVLLAWQLGSSNGDLRKQVEDLANDVQALSHELHSPKLDYLGLAAAAAGFCKELSDRQRVEIEFHSENISKELPKEISLCLFRVLQEALQNAIKHSGSRQFHASLTGGANEIELTVHDSGVGFEPEEAIKGCGLGLTSMQERLKLMQGKLSIDSKPQRGTTIHARVPVIPKTMSAGAVG